MPSFEVAEDGIAFDPLGLEEAHLRREHDGPKIERSHGFVDERPAMAVTEEQARQDLSLQLRIRSDLDRRELVRVIRGKGDDRLLPRKDRMALEPRLFQLVADHRLSTPSMK